MKQNETKKFQKFREKNSKKYFGFLKMDKKNVQN